MEKLRLGVGGGRGRQKEMELEQQGHGDVYFIRRGSAKAASRCGLAFISANLTSSCARKELSERESC